MIATGKGFRLVLWPLAVLLILPLVLSALYFVHGSLEMFPTDEQQSQARTAAAVIFLLSATIETAVLTVLFRIKR